MKKWLKELIEDETKQYSIMDLLGYGVIAIFCTAILGILMFYPISKLL